LGQPSPAALFVARRRNVEALPFPAVSPTKRACMDFLRRVTIFWVMVALAGLCGCNSSSSSSSNPQVPIAASTTQLRPGDSLTIVLQGVPDPSTNAVTIDDKGLISLPYIGTIPAAGLGTAEVSQSIRDTYIAKKIYTTVDVSVGVTERYVYVGGEVQRPGRIVWTPDLTATKAIQSAGGFSLYAKETAVTLIRSKSAYVIDVKLAQKNPTEDPRLIPGDSLQVPRSAF
jgi:polysaccharide biosynthesis/export protein VpsN